MPPIPNPVAVANEVDDFDLGASPDGFNRESTQLLPASENGLQLPAPVISIAQKVKAIFAPVPKAPVPPVGGFKDFAEQLAWTTRTNPATGPAPTREHACSLTGRIAKAAAVKAAVKAAKAAQKQYVEILAENDLLMNPDRQRAEIILEIEATTDAAKLEVLRRKFAECSGPAADAAKQSATRACSAAWPKFKAALDAIFDAAETEISKLAVEAKAAEKALFENFGLSHQPTGVTIRVNQLRERLKHGRENLALKHSRGNVITPGDCGEILTDFES